MQLIQFKDSRFQCGDDKTCRACREDSIAGDKFRAWQTGSEVVECPFNKPMAGFETRPRAKATAGNALSLAQTILTRPRMPPEVVEARQEACAACKYNKTDDKGTFCSAPQGCGCSTKGGTKFAGVGLKVVDITLYGEKKDSLLCRHPRRFVANAFPDNGWQDRPE